MDIPIKNFSEIKIDSDHNPIIEFLPVPSSESLSTPSLDNIYFLAHTPPPIEIMSVMPVAQPIVTINDMQFVNSITETVEI